MTKVLNNDVNSSPLSCFLKTEKTLKISLQNITADGYSPALMVSIIIVTEWIYWPVAPSDDQFPCRAVTTDKLPLAVYIHEQTQQQVLRKKDSGFKTVSGKPWERDVPENPSTQSTSLALRFTLCTWSKAISSCLLKKPFAAEDVSMPGYTSYLFTEAVLQEAQKTLSVPGHLKHAILLVSPNKTSKTKAQLYILGKSLLALENKRAARRFSNVLTATTKALPWTGTEMVQDTASSEMKGRTHQHVCSRSRTVDPHW